MFTLLWKILPGPKWLKLSISVVIGLGIAALMWFTVYPWVYDTYILDDAPILQ